MRRPDPSRTGDPAIDPSRGARLGIGDGARVAWITGAVLASMLVALGSWQGAEWRDWTRRHAPLPAEQRAVLESACERVDAALGWPHGSSRSAETPWWVGEWRRGTGMQSV
jgi:hypothetical protein